jgi:hypothetical protein
MGVPVRPRGQNPLHSLIWGVSGQGTARIGRRATHAARVRPPSSIVCLISGACEASALHLVEIPETPVLPNLVGPVKTTRSPIPAIIATKFDSILSTARV